MGDHDFVAVANEMRQELIRDNYWGLELPSHVVRKASKRSYDQLEATTATVLRSALSPANQREGYQTPWAYRDSATIVHCAQHATGTCCRTCVEKWFGLPRHLPLPPEKLALLRSFVMFYVTERLGGTVRAA